MLVLAGTGGAQYKAAIEALSSGSGCAPRHWRAMVFRWLLVGLLSLLCSALKDHFADELPQPKTTWF